MFSMITLTLSEDRMEIKKKKKLLTYILVCKMFVMSPKHTHIQKNQQKLKTKQGKTIIVC